MEQQRDDALFEQLGKNKKRRRRRVLITVLTVILAVALILTGLVIYLRRTVRQRFSSDTNQVLSYQVKTGTLSTVVSGSGTLEEDDLEAITVRTGSHQSHLHRNIILQPCVTHQLVFLVGQGLRRSHGDGVASVDAHRVKVLDGADDDAVVLSVADNLHLVLLPADERLVYEKLVGRGEIKSSLADRDEVLGVVGDSAARAAHGE